MCCNEETTNLEHILSTCDYSCTKFTTEDLVKLHSIQQFVASTADVLSYLPYDKARYNFCEYFSHTNSNGPAVLYQLASTSIPIYRAPLHPHGPPQRPGPRSSITLMLFTGS